MPGFCISNSKIEVQLNNCFNEKCVQENLNAGMYYFKRNTLNKFMNDKTFQFADNMVIVVDGVILNKHHLFEKYVSNNIYDLCKKMYRSNGETFFSEFRGSFSGTLYDVEKGKLIAYTNHIGDHPLYYCFYKNNIIIGSQVDYVISLCSENNIPLTLNENAAYHMLTFAFMESNITYANEIKRLNAGEYICIDNGKINVKTYHRFSYDKKRFEGYTEDEIIIEIDKAFRHAIDLEYDKDEEYGLKHRGDLSGGLDSRMSMWVAHSIKKRHIQLNTCCFSGDLEEVIAREVAYHWRDEICVRSDENLAFLYDIDIMTRMLGGLSLYIGPTGELRIMLDENQDRYGVKHTGQVGDAILGCFGKKDGEKIIWPTGRYSERIAYKVDKFTNEIRSSYLNDELYLLYTRGFLGAINTHQFVQNFTEATSPFLDVDFFQLCLDIPQELRIGHYIYKEWIFKFYPEAANYKWERINDYISNDEKVIKEWYIKRKEKNNNGSIKHKIDCYFEKDKIAQRFWDEYYDQHIFMLEKIASKELVESCQRMYFQGNVFEKSMVITCLASVKMYFYS